MLVSYHFSFPLLHFSKKYKKRVVFSASHCLLSFIIATILDLLSQRSRRETYSNCSVKERGTSFYFITFILSLLLFLRLCYPFNIVQLNWFCTLFIWFNLFFSKFHFNFLYLSRLVTKQKEEGIVKCSCLLILSIERKTSCSGIVWCPKERGTFLFLFSHWSFDIVFALLWL